MVWSKYNVNYHCYIENKTMIEKNYPIIVLEDAHLHDTVFYFHYTYIWYVLVQTPEGTSLPQCNKVLLYS